METTPPSTYMNAAHDPPSMPAKTALLRTKDAQPRPLCLEGTNPSQLSCRSSMLTSPLLGSMPHCVWHAANGKMLCNVHQSSLWCYLGKAGCSCNPAMMPITSATIVLAVRPSLRLLNSHLMSHGVHIHVDEQIRMQLSASMAL